MNNKEVLTISKNRPIDELFTLIYISQLPHEDVGREISSFIDNHGPRETCTMLLQILCNPNDAYQLNFKFTDNSSKSKKNSVKNANSSSRSFFEERKEHEYEEEIEPKVSSFADSCITRSPNESMLSYARSIFYKIGNEISWSVDLRTAVAQNKEAQTSVCYKNINDRVILSEKMNSLYLYTSRILQPIYDNYIAYVTSLKSNQEFLPNIGVSEKRVTAVKLTNLITFIKNEEKYLKKIDKEDVDAKRNNRDTGYAYTKSDPMNNYENILCKEAEDLDLLKLFIFRCIMAIEFLDEISKVPADFTQAIRQMSSDERAAMNDFKFNDLMTDLLENSVFNNFLKCLLVVKAEQCGDIKEAKRMCEVWHKRCNIFISREFITTFIAEYHLLFNLQYQLQNKTENKKIDEEIFNMCFRDLKEHPNGFDIDKIVYLFIKLDRVRELFSLLSIRFLYIGEYEEQESKYSTKEHYSNIAHEKYRQQERECVKPMLEVLQSIINAYIKKIKNNDGGALTLINSILETKKEETIYEYYFDKCLQKMTVQSLLALKSDLIEVILLHDNERLHSSILDWMYEQKLFEELQKVSSKHYDKFIKDIEEKSSYTSDQIDLICKYLAKSQDHSKLINFLVPIIDCDVSSNSSKVNGECSIKQRLIYSDMVISSIYSIMSSSTNSLELENILKHVEKLKEILIIQSDVENILLKMKNENKNQNEVRRISEKLELLNSKIFNENDLINEFAKPMRLYDMIISIYRQSAMNSGVVPKNCKEEIEDCYCHILIYYCENRKKDCPRILYDVLLNYAKSFYFNQEDGNSMISKRTDKTFSSVFFPIDSLLKIVERINADLFGHCESNCSYIDEALNDERIKGTPYWFVGLLQKIFINNLSRVISLLYARFNEEKKLSSLYELIIAIKRYSMIVSEIEQGTLNPEERSIINDYKGFELTINQIIKKIKTLFDDDFTRAQMNQPMLDKLNQLLDDVIKPKVGYPDISKITQIKESPSVKLNVSFKDSPTKDSFQISSSKSSKKHDMERQIFEEEKTKHFEDSDSDGSFVRQKKPQGKPIPKNPVEDRQPKEKALMHAIPRNF